jgi:hypothetical protein
MDFNRSNTMENPGSTVPWIEKYQSENESIGVGMCPWLMATFNFPALVYYIRSTPVGYQNLSSRLSLQE